MLTHVPRLPFSLDPLIAEAKRRMRRRRAVAGTVTLAAVVAAVFFGAQALQGPGGGIAGHGPLSGSWHGIPWRIRAADSGDGRYGMTVLIAGSPVASRSGRLYVPEPSGAAPRIGWTSKAQGRLPFVAGAVPIKPCCEQEFASVTVRLSNGSLESTTATVPPYTLTHAPGIAFFFLPTPGGTHPTAIVARNGAGHVIARWKRAR